MAETFDKQADNSQAMLSGCDAVGQPFAEPLAEPLADTARRRFLQQLGLLAGAGAVAAGGLAGCGNTPTSDPASDATASRSGASGQQRWGLFVDAGKCATDCRSCVDGCNQEHGIDTGKPAATQAQWIWKMDLRDPVGGAVTSLPMLCQHCESAPCVDVCPTGASFRRVDGIVLVNKHTCIGCRYCMMACPFKARSFVHETLTEQKPDAPRGKGIVESCTLCVHRVDRDPAAQPACAEACTEAGHAAIVFGDLNDPDSQVSQAIARHKARAVRADYRLRTGVRYAGI